MYIYVLLLLWSHFSSLLLFTAGTHKQQILNLLCTYNEVIFLSLQLFDVVYREETLVNVIRSVTRNGRSIVLTAVLALILVYLFSIIGYIFFKDDFLVEVDADESQMLTTTTPLADITISKPTNDADSTCNAPDAFNKGSFTGDSNNAETATSTPAATGAGCGGDEKERSCDSLVMCIVTTLNQGLRNGGGIGDILRSPSSKVSRKILSVRLCVRYTKDKIY